MGSIINAQLTSFLTGLETINYVVDFDVSKSAESKPDKLVI